MAIASAAKGDLVLIDATAQGLNGLFLVSVPDNVGQTMDVLPINSPSALRAVKDLELDPDWPKTVAFAHVVALYSADAIGF